jgi:tyrosyl-tRNA synthetase
MPTCELSGEQIAESGLRLTDLLVLAKLASSKSDARRLIEGGGVFVDDEKVTSVSAVLGAEKVEGEGVIIRKGKKSYCRIVKA